MDYIDIINANILARKPVDVRASKPAVSVAIVAMTYGIVKCIL
jgi:hypothetical protein